MGRNPNVAAPARPPAVHRRRRRPRRDDARPGPAPAGAATNPAVAAPAATASGWKARPAQYTATTSVKDLAIPMSDGVMLRGDLTLPANADGKPIGAKVPVVVTITAYNKTIIAGGFGGTSPAPTRRTSSSAATRSSPSTLAAPARARASGTPSTSVRTRTPAR